MLEQLARAEPRGSRQEPGRPFFAQITGHRAYESQIARQEQGREGDRVILGNQGHIPRDPPREGITGFSRTKENHVYPPAPFLTLEPVTNPGQPGGQKVAAARKIVTAYFHDPNGPDRTGPNLEGVPTQ